MNPPNIPIMFLIVASLLTLPISTKAVEPLRCSIGFGTNIKVDIPPERINDGYCDCPDDGGIDEVETGACSGSSVGGWPGDSNGNDETKIIQFQCHEQEDIQIPLSRLNDGICDCCDGSDEFSSSQSCPNFCEERFAADRAAKAHLLEKFKLGSTKRKSNLEEYSTMYQTTLEEIKTITDYQLPDLIAQMDSLDSEINTNLIQAYSNRVQYVKVVLEHMKEEGGPTDMIIPGGSVKQLENFITSICHLSGELADANPTAITNNGNKKGDWKTCIPLRLAGLDLGILWENVKEKDENTMKAQIGGWDDRDLGLKIAGILNEVSISSDYWSEELNEHHEKTSFNRNEEQPSDFDRDEKYYNDDFYGFDDEDFTDEGVFDEMVREDKERENEGIADEGVFDKMIREDKENENEGIADEGVFDKMIREDKEKENMQRHPFQKLRDPFHKEAKRIIKNIEEQLKEKNSVDEESKDGEGEITTENNIDPMALQMVQSSLTRRIGHINRGIIYASSAEALLPALKSKILSASNEEEYMQTLSNLAIGLLQHSQLSAMDIIEAIGVSSIIDEISDKTCVSIYTILCPVTQIEITLIGGKTVNFPGDALSSDAIDRCIKRKNTNTNICEMKEDEAGIPMNIPDGYFEFYVPKPRNHDDYYSEYFSNMEEHKFDAGVNELEFNRGVIQEDISSLDETLSELKDKIGYQDDSGKSGKSIESKYGPDGELYPFRDECFEITAGKYTYELCIFQGAHQRDISSKGGGTSLGKWKSMILDPESGERIMKWEGGEKCWNGPKRSATVEVTCGSEEKLLSADEPNICEYVFKMESSIACDESFREKHKL